MDKKLLEDLKVLDFTTVIAGPFITKILSAYGARIIKIESRSRPGLFRQFGPYHDDILRPVNPWFNRGGGFGFWNTGKLSVAINLSHPGGVELAKRLVAWADVVVENFAGGVMKRMGLGYEELKKVKPDIIMLSSCMQGQTGPHANHPGYGTQLVNLAGFSNISGWPDREPANIGPYTDYIAPRLSVLAIMGALEYRRRTGKGQYIDLSQYEGGLHLMAPLILDRAVNQRIAFRMGNKSLTAVPHGAYPCRDRNQKRWCAIAVYTDEEWQAFCKVIGNPPWTRDDRFGTLQSRRQNEEELNMLIERWTVNLSADDIVQRMQEAEVPAGVLSSREEMLEYRTRVKGHSPYTVPHDAYRCRWEDRWCAISVSTDEEWENFCRVIGNPQWTEDGRFTSIEGRRQNEEELDRLISEWTIRKTAEEVMDMMQSAGVAAGVVATGEDLMEHDLQLKHRRFFRELEHPEIGKYHGVTPSYIMSKCPCEIERAPLMGEHNEYVLKDVLGISDEEIRELINQGIIE